MAAIDGKQIANMLYHAGVETLLTVGYSELGRKLLRRPAPKVDFNMGDIAKLSIVIMLAMATRDMLIKQGIGYYSSGYYEIIYVYNFFLR